MANLSETAQEIVVGNYALRRLANGMLWLETESGEGMQISDEETFQTVLDKFYKENF